MLHIVLVEPEIPPNTGNIIRLTANTGFHLHLIEPLGFQLDNARLRRAGLDYHDLANVHTHVNLTAFYELIKPLRVFALSSKVSRCYSDIAFADHDAFVFGPESRGLTQDQLNTIPAEHRLRIPMVPGSRSLNLANSVAVVAYEAWRQCGFISAL
jgi:tRNA (cytidine/uridine-2'-O-)-methyltransferase